MILYEAVNLHRPQELPTDKTFYLDTSHFRSITLFVYVSSHRPFTFSLAGAMVPAMKPHRPLSPYPAMLRVAGCVVALIVAGCSDGGDGQVDDDEAIVRSVLSLIVERNGPVCIDRTTDGDSLSIFREMMRAPYAARRDLRWFPPTGLSVPASEPISPPSRQRSDALPAMQQQALNGAATRMARPWNDIRHRLTLTGDALPTGVVARWWPINRFRRCAPLFSMRDPVRHGNLGFVTIEANHHAALYAVERRQGRWTPVSEWSNWLY